MLPNILKSVTGFAVILLIIFSGCEKTPDPDIQTVKDQSKAALVISDAFAVSNGHSSEQKMLSEYPECMTHAWNETRDTLTISFDNCTYNEVLRNGSFSVSFSGEWGQGVTMSIGFNNYSVDGNIVSGNLSATYGSIGEEGRIFTVEASDMNLIFPDESSVSWNSLIEYQMTSGFLTFFNPADDVYILNGSGQGINREGEAYETQYNKVERRGDCKWPVAGSITITKAESDPIEIDFDQDGDAECDNIVQVTQSGVSIQVQL
jgi:hypothetical protein